MAESPSATTATSDNVNSCGADERRGDYGAQADHVPRRREDLHNREGAVSLPEDSSPWESGPLGGAHRLGRRGLSGVQGQASGQGAEEARGANPRPVCPATDSPWPTTLGGGSGTSEREPWQREAQGNARWEAQASETVLTPLLPPDSAVEMFFKVELPPSMDSPTWPLDLKRQLTTQAWRFGSVVHRADCIGRRIVLPDLPLPVLDLLYFRGILNAEYDDTEIGDAINRAAIVICLRKEWQEYEYQPQRYQSDLWLPNRQPYYAQILTNQINEAIRIWDSARHQSNRTLNENHFRHALTWMNVRAWNEASTNPSWEGPTKWQIIANLEEVTPRTELQPEDDLNGSFARLRLVTGWERDHAQNETSLGIQRVMQELQDLESSDSSASFDSAIRSLVLDESDFSRHGIEDNEENRA